jgi:ABC-type polysaccharide/polyol phosphate transport system ATPase subunit
MARIDLDHCSLTFSLRRTRNVTLKEYLLKGMFLRSVNPKVPVHALAKINLKAEDGERIGIIGHNGAGKSTLLKLIAGVYPPTSGTRVVDGRICSLFDISLGFEFDATGWDNIRYRSYLQGETPKTLETKMNEIAEFTELGDFLNMPVRYYSAGMMVRLAFAIATAVEPEVLLIDEVLSVGDHAFQAKAHSRMKQLMTRSRLMVMVSHDLASVASLCTRALWLNRGTVAADGEPQTIVNEYLQSIAPPDQAHPVGGIIENPPVATDDSGESLALPDAAVAINPAEAPTTEQPSSRAVA